MRHEKQIQGLSAERYVSDENEEECGKVPVYRMESFIKIRSPDKQSV
jgi:hypothetical protein